MQKRFPRMLGGALVAALLWTGAADAAPAIGGLGDSLLDPELARRLAPAQPKTKPPSGPSLLPEGGTLERMIEQGARETAGEDVGASPLDEVISAMRRAERLIVDQADSRVAVPVQREAVTRLEQLIAQMEKQCNCQGSSQTNKSADGRRQKSRRTQSKPGQSPESQQQAEANKPGQGSKPGKPSANPGGQPVSSETVFAGAPDASPVEQQRLMKNAWGHLPERVREQMLQGPGDEFLPAYREELRQYYRRLAERSAEESP